LSENSKVRKGALYGLLVGGVLALIGGISSIGVEGHGFFDSFIDGLIFFGLPGALIGAAIGAIVSILSKAKQSKKGED
jgi:hypothetical protein